MIFFTPINEGIHDILNKVFHQSYRIGSSTLDWLRYIEPREGLDPSESEIKDGNLTRYVDTSSPERDGELTKSMYKLPTMIELGIHQSEEYVSKAFHRSVTPQNLAYMAHIKKTHVHN